MSRQPVRLTVFDLDGTLQRGETVYEAIARALGHLVRVRELEGLTHPEEIKAACEEMVAWYASVPLSELCLPLARLQLSPRKHEGFHLLRH